MGTRADFYVGRGKDAEWLGSIAWDGYPGGFNDDSGTVGDPRESSILRATTEDTYRAAVQRVFGFRSDATTPEMGWPWPWDDSGTTDCAYAFDDGRVWLSSFGSPWCSPDLYFEEGDPEGDAPAFPDMSKRKATTLGPRSGLIVVSAPPEEKP